MMEMVNAGVDIGAHTMSHVNLANTSGEILSYEIRESKRVLEEWTGRDVEVFAYPYGKYTEEVKSIVARAGYLGACSTRLGVTERDADAFTLKRMNIHDDVSVTRSMFACRIANFAGIF